MSDLSFLNSITVTRDIADILLGKLIAEGSSRLVYECAIDPSLVVKIEGGARSFQNVKEWETWQEVQYIDGLKGWFAPCVAISASGTVLLQKKVVTAYRKHYPKKIPKCLGDLKYSNFGILNGRFVCVDYGTLLSSNGFHTGLKTAKWWDEA